MSGYKFYGYTPMTHQRLGPCDSVEIRDGNGTVAGELTPAAVPLVLAAEALYEALKEAEWDTGERDVSGKVFLRFCPVCAGFDRDYGDHKAGHFDDCKLALALAAAREPAAGHGEAGS